MFLHVIIKKITEFYMRISSKLIYMSMGYIVATLDETEVSL